MAFRARKVFGTFEKRGPGTDSHTSVILQKHLENQVEWTPFQLKPNIQERSKSLRSYLKFVVELLFLHSKEIIVS